MTTETAPTEEGLSKSAARSAMRKREWAARKATPAAPAEDPRIAALLKTVEGLTARLEAAEQKTDNPLPMFVPMKHEPPSNLAGTYQPPEAIQAKALKGMQKAGDQTAGRVGLYNSPEYLKKIPPKYRPAFKSGDVVRINPDSLIWGSANTWGPLLEQKKIDGRGEVMCFQYFTETYEPKYTVHVPGLTRKDGDGFRESELLPA